MKSELRGHTPRHDLRTAIEQSVERVIYVFSIVLFVFIIILQGWNVWQSALEQVDGDAQMAAASLAEVMGRWQRALRLVASDLENVCASGDRGCASSQLDQLLRWEPSLATSLVTDAEGLVVAAAASPDLGLASAASLHGASVIDRDYFQEPRRSGLAFVSSVFPGRGFGEDRIVALSVPLYERNGRFRGVLQASVTARNFEEWADAIRGNLSSTDLKLSLTDMLGQSLLPVVVESDGGTGSAEVWRAGPWHAAAMRGIPQGFRIALQSPPHSWMQPLVPVALLVLGSAVALLLLVRRAVRSLSGRLTAPLQQLRDVVHRVELGDLGAIEECPAPDESWTEACEIHHALLTLLQRTRKVGRELHEANIALARSNADLVVAIDEREGYIERQTRRLQDALSAAWASAEARSQLIANTSHEIRTPLNGVLGTTELLLRSEPLSASQERLLRVQLGAGRVLLTLVNDILDLSRLSRGLLLETEPFDVTQDCALVCDSLRALASEGGLYLTLLPSAELYPFRKGDRARFRQLILGLVGNALKFTEKGGVKLLLSDSANYELIVEVQDTGTGIPASKFDAVFEPYVQLDSSMTRQRGGVGLGLAIVKSIVSAMDGRIALESEVGRGSVFRVSLPLAMAQPEDITFEEREVKVDLSGLRVLVVDDIDMNRDLLELQLGALGCKARKASGGVEALDLIEANTFDLVLLDCQMPEMDGYEVARAVRERWPNRFLRLVAVTAHAQPGERERCLEAGMDDYVAKPLSMNTLSRVLQEACTIANNLP